MSFRENSSLRSDRVLKGDERAPNRSLFYSMGYTDEELKRPLIGVISAYSEIVPGHIHLDKLSQAVKTGVLIGGEFRLLFLRLEFAMELLWDIWE